MKKVLFLIGAMLLGLLNIQPALAGPSVNQRFTAGAESVLIDDVAQTFKPSVSGLSYVDVQLSNVAPGQTASIAIVHRTGEKFDVGRVAALNNQPIVNGWNTFDFPDITVTKEDTYGIFIVAAAPAQWVFSQNNGTYPRGNTCVVMDTGTVFDMISSDLNFRTWGTTPVEMVEEQVNPGSDKTDDETGAVATSTSTAVPNGGAPSQSTSSSIVKPSELKAEYTEGVKLSWKASTTSAIDGYIVFRSETKGSGYEKIGQTEKSILEYTDSTAVADKTYYYVARAFSGSLQSVNSNETSLAIPASANPIVPQNLAVTSFSDNEIDIAWDKSPEANITSYNISWSIGDQVQGSVSVDVNTFEYIISDLQSNTEYKIELTATNSEGKVSSPASTIQTTKTSDVVVVEKNNTKFWIWSGTALLLLLILLGLLLYRSKKKQEAGKTKNI